MKLIRNEQKFEAKVKDNKTLGQFAFKIYPSFLV